MHKLSLIILASLFAALGASAKVVLSEDFAGFSAGTEANPSDIITDFDAFTATNGWSGISVRQAGGCAYIPAEAQLATPKLDLGAGGGNYCISFKAKSNTPEAFYFLMDSNGGFMSGYITDEWTTYTVALPTGSGPSIKQEPTIVYFYGYTDFFIDDLVIDDSGVAVTKALPATDFNSKSFTANWESSFNAKTYLLNVFTLDYDVATTIFSRKHLVKDLEVEGTSAVVELDDFATPYYYTVSAKSGNAVAGESNVITVYPDNVEPVEALAPSDVTDTSFTANWTTSELATQYHLHILHHHQATADETFAIIDTDFSDVHSDASIEAPRKELEWLFEGDWFANMPVMADGIIGINNQDIDFFGQAYLQSPVIDLSSCQGELKITFTAFGRKGLSNGLVRLYNYSPGLTVADSQDFSVTNEPNTYTFNLSGGSKTSVLLITSEDPGMMFIDDLKVTVELPAQSSIILPVRTITNTETSATVSRDGISNADRLAYYVVASWAVNHKEGEVRQIPEVLSEPSNYVWVDENASVEDILTEGDEGCSITTDGQTATIVNPSRRPISVFTPEGVCINSISHPAETTSIHFGAGCYIVRAGTRSFKLYF